MIHFPGTRVAQLSLNPLTDGESFLVQYTTPPNGKAPRVSINLIHNEQNFPLTFDVRYDKINHHVVIVSLRDNQWQRQERPAGFPFDSGYLTTVRIVPDITAGAYKIFADGNTSMIYSFTLEAHQTK